MERILFWGTGSLRKGGAFMYRVSVESSTLATVSYDARKLLLELEFANATVYLYRDVPAAVHEQLLAAPSKGRFFNLCIRGRFAHQRVVGPLAPAK